MRRIHWTLDLQEAEIVAGLLRAEGIDAFVFDEGVVRQNWATALAYGGYRVMVAAPQAEQGRLVLTAWRQGEYALPEEADDALHCPRCNATDIQPDRRRRGWSFVVAYVLGLPIPWRWQRRVHCRHCDYRWNRAPGDIIPDEHAH